MKKPYLYRIYLNSRFDLNLFYSIQILNIFESIKVDLIRINRIYSHKLCIRYIRLICINRIRIEYICIYSNKSIFTNIFDYEDIFVKIE